LNFLFFFFSLPSLFSSFDREVNNNLGKLYFCKSAKDLDKRMGALGALRLTPFCCGDDQVTLYVGIFIKLIISTFLFLFLNHTLGHWWPA
jgi:hypothetical protein